MTLAIFGSFLSISIPIDTETNVYGCTIRQYTYFVKAKETNLVDDV
jgi:hypothetical protein